MLRVGIVGIGFMGMIHYLAWRRVHGAKVVAVASRDPVKLAGDWRGVKGNFGPPGTQMDLQGIKTYRDSDQLLADPDVDLVDVCLPPNLHAAVSIAALKAGKHVLCEKPIALAGRDGARMVKAAETAGKQLLIAHVLPFVGEYAYAAKLAAGRKHGRLLGGHFKRIISDPLWLKDFYNPDLVGGPMVDLHIHDAHFIRLLYGMPRAVFTSGRLRGKVAEFFTSQFLFDDPALAVTATSGVIQQQGRSFTHGFEIHFERATLVYDFSVVDGKPVLNIPLTVLTRDGKATQPAVGSADPVTDFVAELTDAVKAIRGGKVSPLLDGRLASDALVLCEKQTASLTSGRLVKI
jgi:predicted dehydrogenase